MSFMNDCTRDLMSILQKKNNSFEFWPQIKLKMSIVRLDHASAHCVFFFLFFFCQNMTYNLIKWLQNEHDQSDLLRRTLMSHSKFLNVCDWRRFFFELLLFIEKMEQLCWLCSIESTTGCSECGGMYCGVHLRRHRLGNQCLPIRWLCSASRDNFSVVKV